jgi:hypothetical protein
MFKVRLKMRKMVAVAVCFAGVTFFSGCDKKEDVKISETIEIKSSETACISQNRLSLRVVNVNDSRCPKGAECYWEGNAYIEFQLTTKNVEYSFTLDTHLGSPFRNDTIIEGIKYQLRNVLPYPNILEEQPIKTVRILVGNTDVNFNATVLGKGLDCDNSFLIVFDEGVTGLPNSYRINYEINLPEYYKIEKERVSVKFRAPEDNELMVCTAMGPAYPQIYIVETK